MSLRPGDNRRQTNTKRRAFRDALVPKHGTAGNENADLNRDGNAPATTKTFSDSAQDTDHRPLLVTIESDAEQRIEALKEDIAIREQVLARMKQTLQALEDAQQ